MLLSSVVFGVLDTIYAEVESWERASLLLDGLSFGFLLLLWCAYDARLQDFWLSTGLRVVVFLIPIVGFPVYAFKSRGQRGWGLLGLGVVFFILSMGLSIVTSWLTETIGGFSK